MQPFTFSVQKRVSSNLLHSFPATRKTAITLCTLAIRLLGNGLACDSSIITIRDCSGMNADDAEAAALAAIANFHPANARATIRRYTSVKVNRRVLLFAGLLCLRKLRIRATIIVTSVTYSPGWMAVTMAATPPPIAREGTPRGEIEGGV